MSVADSRQVDCFGDKSPRNDGVESLESSLRNSTHSVESWQSTQDLQVKFRANEVDLSNICTEILARIAKNRHIIFLLQGDIGAGKTTLVKAFAKYVKIKDSVTSPTFSLLHIYNAEFALDSATFTPFSSISLDSFRKRAAPPAPLPLRAKSCHFSLLGGEPRFSDSSKKSAGGTTAPFDSDFLHHESGEILGASHNSLLDSANFPNSQNLTLYHYDLFNRNLGELLDLGLLDLLEQRGIHFVEWGNSQLFDIIKNAFENICIISIHKTKNDRIYEFKESF